MARWTVTPGTENNTMKGTIDYSNDGNSCLLYTSDAADE